MADTPRRQTKNVTNGEGVPPTTKTLAARQSRDSQTSTTAVRSGLSRCVRQGRLRSTSGIPHRRPKYARYWARFESPWRYRPEPASRAGSVPLRRTVARLGAVLRNWVEAHFGAVPTVTGDALVFAPAATPPSRNRIMPIGVLGIRWPCLPRARADHPDLCRDLALDQAHLVGQITISYRMYSGPRAGREARALPLAGGASPARRRRRSVRARATRDVSTEKAGRLGLVRRCGDLGSRFRRAPSAWLGSYVRGAARVVGGTVLAAESPWRYSQPV